MADYVLTVGNIWLLSWMFICALVENVFPQPNIGGSVPLEDSSIRHDTTAQSLDDVEDDSFLDVYGLTGFQHEFKIEVRAGGSECFFQKMKPPVKLHFSFEVLRGADRNIDVRILDPNEKLIGDFQWTNEGNFEYNISTTGIYSLCIDNGLSRFSSKLVYLYLLSYNELDWHRYVKGVTSFFDGMENVTKSLEKFDQDINKVLVMQAMGRRHLMADWYLIKSNNSYVQRLSIAMCVVVLLASAIQVIFVRRLFHTSPKTKPRA